MSNEKMIMAEINGIQYNVNSFIVFYENNVTRISLTIDDTIKIPSAIDTTHVPQDIDLTRPYILEGTEYAIDDAMYKTLKELSNLRGHTQKQGIKETKELSSQTHNVKDINSFKDAVTELVVQENELFTQGYKFFTEVTKPTATFETEDSGCFKLKEKIIVVKVTEKKKIK